MSSVSFYDFLLKVCGNLVVFSNGAFYICMSNYEYHNLWRAFTESGGHFQTNIIWAKNSWPLSRSDYQHMTENIIYGLSDEEMVKIENSPTSDGQPILYGWTDHEWYGGRKQGDVWFFDRPTKSKEHPTMKPVMLCAKAILNSSRRGELVLDPFLGSGSTLIAAEKIGRVCYGMELDPLYVDVVVRRWEDYTGKKAIKENGNK